MGSFGGVRTMEQRIDAGSDFDGTTPPGSVVREFGIEKYASAATGGLFDFSLTEPHMLRSIELKLGGQTFWTIHKRDTEGDEILYCCGTDETTFVTTEADSIILTDKQKVVVRTVGASGPLIARVTIQQIKR